MINIASVSKKLISGLDQSDPVLAKPAGLRVGDLMIAIFFSYPYNGSYSASGWTSVYTNMPNTSYYVGYAILKKIATQADVDASTFSFTLSGDAIYNGGIIYRIPEGDFNKVQISTNIAGTVTPQSSRNIVILNDVTGDNDSDYSTFSGYTLTGGVSPTFTEEYDDHEASYMRNSLGSAWGRYDSTSNITAFNITATNSGVDTEFKFMLVIGEVPQINNSNMFLMF